MVDQAILVHAMFGETTKEQLQQYVDTGQLEGAGEEVIPYDPSVMESLQRQSQVE